ncbi:unnamed protein product [Didymodactylos carnosus]|uniref:NHL repeat-containing protein n=1 Tax=Didymodactylos carnosus TaxID=1234261 RepID=A0A813Y1B0_9BILA|nr:unnamed protein product [Didymodactylos carnosus]CAF1131568.1 unnamed protein product [Didymodactylos carnosus]CAF3660557.1 unnamed protein product [Didymodactylos carnosus]CAF3915509.1 unnamed protein product [Didymodactylos carnosus]
MSHLNVPHDVAVDLYGNLYVADMGNHRIQCIIMKDGVRIATQTIAGVSGNTGSSDGYLSRPCAIAFDFKWNLFVTDHNNHRVQKFLCEGGDLYC